MFYLEASDKWSTMGLFLQPVLLHNFINSLIAPSSSWENFWYIQDVEFRGVIHRELDRLEKWDRRNQLNLSRTNTKCCPWTGKTTWCKDTRWCQTDWEQLCKKRPGALAGTAGWTANCTLSCVNGQDIKGRVYPSLLIMCLKAHLKYCTHCLLPNTRTTLTNWIKFSGGHQAAQGEKLRVHGFFSLEKRWLWWHLAVACLYLQGGNEGSGSSLFKAECERTRATSIIRNKRCSGWKIEKELEKELEKGPNRLPREDIVSLSILGKFQDHTE